MEFVPVYCRKSGDDNNYWYENTNSKNTNDYPSYHDWDICAGHILVEEAKGTLTNLSGETILYGKAGYQKKGFLASNGLLHKALLSKIQG